VQTAADFDTADSTYDTGEGTGATGAGAADTGSAPAGAPGDTSYPERAADGDAGTGYTDSAPSGAPGDTSYPERAAGEDTAADDTSLAPSGAPGDTSYPERASREAGYHDDGQTADTALDDTAAGYATDERAESTSTQGGDYGYDEARAGAAAAGSYSEGPFGPGSAEPAEDGSGPAGWQIKGNAGSMLVHNTDSPSYEAVRAEVWFESEEAAKAAGFAHWEDRKSTRLNSSHVKISYAVFCLKTKKAAGRTTSWASLGRYPARRRPPSSHGRYAGSLHGPITR